VTVSSPATIDPAPACFHCGLPVPAGKPWRASVLGEIRDFCCGGCRAVAEAISRGGLDDYYRLRTENAPTATSRDDSDDRLFDREDFQASFVRGVGDRREASLVIDGVRCPACLWLIERRLRSQPGVSDAALEYASRTARVVWDPARVKLSEIRIAVREIGYETQPFDASHRAGLESDASRRGAPRLLFAGALGMMVMNLALAAYFLGGPDAGGRLPLWETFGRWAALVGSAVLLAYPGQEFFAGAWRDLRNRRAGMDAPIALGLAAAWIGGAWATVKGAGPVYFDAIGMLVFFVLLARAFETRARLRSAAVLDRLAIVRPATANRVDPDGREAVIAAFELSPGDVIRVRPGETVPADGTVLEGEASFDESVVTGEPWPRGRGPGDPVVAGSIDRDQPVLVHVTRVGGESTLGEIRRLLERGLASRPRFAELADRLAGRLVVAVLALSGATAVFWALRDPAVALPATVAVLIVTCPCALALATPIALAVAAGRFAAMGVLPARMAAIERLALADSVGFDKTGTLTMPAPILDDVETSGGLGREEALAIAAALETGSDHPIARAIRAAAPWRAEATAVRHGDRSISGNVAGVRWRLGSPAGGEGEKRGKLAAALTAPDGRRAVFTFAEELRPGAREIVGELRREGIGHAALLSGDAGGTVESLGSFLGFDEVRAGMSAAEKLEWIRSRKDDGDRLLFVGDGLNDAPTLAAAGASASFAEAPQLSRLSSDFVLLGNDLGALAAARRIARRSRRLLVQNVVWALAYNLVSVPLAAFGLVPPWAAALGMSASSLAVVANAMRLARPLPGERVTGETDVRETSVKRVQAVPHVLGESRDPDEAHDAERDDRKTGREAHPGRAQ
jgi:Cu2+-exporting ATPase